MSHSEWRTAKINFSFKDTRSAEPTSHALNLRRAVGPEKKNNKLLISPVLPVLYTAGINNPWMFC